MTSDQQRAELHKTIWRIANDLRGSVDGWDFKNIGAGHNPPSTSIIKFDTRNNFV